jgi:hypothetical protein
MAHSPYMMLEKCTNDVFMFRYLRVFLGPVKDGVTQEGQVIAATKHAVKRRK